MFSDILKTTVDAVGTRKMRGETSWSKRLYSSSITCSTTRCGRRRAVRKVPPRAPRRRRTGSCLGGSRCSASTLPTPLPVGPTPPPERAACARRRLARSARPKLVCAAAAGRLHPPREPRSQALQRARALSRLAQRARALSRLASPRDTCLASAGGCIIKKESSRHGAQRDGLPIAAGSGRPADSGDLGF